MPPREQLQEIEEPIVQAQIITKSKFIGSVINLCIKKRGIFKNQIPLVAHRTELIFNIPLNEIIVDFFDQLKSTSHGYASLEYQPMGFTPANLVKLDILINGQRVDALSAIVHRDNAYHLGKKICEKAKDIIPRHLFEVAIQAAIGGKIIARSTIKALRKNVTEPLYGGDVSRKKKLLEAQKRGKKRMKAVGKVQMPPDAFLHLLKV